ncbi:zinc finger-containing ubiquitin peptidase 1 isoform X4 [Trachinotus anak]|uniref:zinc finger-containing ubiquitin peptidase 1 isoform X4 n=1 Tax=Trachinotus anak TaxID=443729 RepID=UPI0039F20C63
MLMKNSSSSSRVQGPAAVRLLWRHLTETLVWVFNVSPVGLLSQVTAAPQQLQESVPADMLTCDICGEEVLLVEDMKTHLLLSHLENDVHCPLCSLSGVSYNELFFHISSAHPEKQLATQGTTDLTVTGVTESQGPQTSQSCSAEDGCDQAGSAAPTGASAVTTDSVRPKQNSTPERGCSSSPEGTGPIAYTATSQSPETRPESVRHREDNTAGFESENNKAKQKRLSSPRKEKLFSCPMCALVCSSCFVLQEHVELHLEEQHSAEGAAVEEWSPAMTSPSASSVSGEKRLECPMCSVVFSDSFSLQEHVELHLDHGAAAGSPGSDLRLATQLQQEEEQRRRREEAQQEREEFKKLQRQFGLDGRGGYRRQMERTMERAVARGHMAPAEFHCKRAEMMESLASGVDDGRTRTQEMAVPSIPRVQSMIEEAWRGGLDPQGASHFNQQLQGTRAWIGATEIYSLLTSLGIRRNDAAEQLARIIDFHQPTGPRDTHPQLFDWVKQYFCQPSRSSRLPPRLIQTSLPPLYLQHQGHSRSVVGLEQKKNGTLCLLVLDPGSPASDTRKLLSRDTVSPAVRHLRKFPSSLKHKQYQVVAVQGVLTAEEKQRSILNSRTLCAERIP